MVAEPSATAVTVPLLTEATEGFEVDQVTVFSVASDGLTVAVRTAVAPISRLSEPGLTETLETGTLGSSVGPQETREENRKTAATAARDTERRGFIMN